MTNLKLVSREFEGFERAFAFQIEAFAKVCPEIRIETEFLELTKHYGKMIGGRGAERGEADLFLCVTDWLPEAIDQDLLTPLDGFLADDPPEGWPDGWSKSMLELQIGPSGEAFGMPYHDGPEIFMYRRDLFEDPAEKSAFLDKYGYDLAPPKNWTQFVEIATFFTRPQQSLWGTCLGGFPDAHNNVYDFMIHLWCRGGALVGANRKPRFHESEGEAALAYLVDLYHRHRVVSMNCLALDSVGSGLYYAQGNAAMMWNWSGFAALAEDPSASTIVGKNACASMPAHDGPNGRAVSLNIYWVLTIPSGSKNKEAAYQFLKHAAAREMDKATSMHGGNGTRLSTWRDPEVQSAFPYYRIIEEVHQHVESPPKIPEFSAIAEALNKMVDDALNLRTTVRGALDHAAREVAKVLGSQ